MRFFTRIAALLLFILTACFAAEEDAAQKEQFLKNLSGAYVTEDGQFGTSTGDEKQLSDYILKNWKELLENLDSIPPPQGSKNLLIGTIGLAAEDLEPTQYVDFLESYMTLAESGQIPLPIVGLQLGGRARKNYFLAVNWKDDRVAAIFQRALKLFPESGEANHEALVREASGKLADNYRTGRPDDAPDPETLPGIELRPRD